MRRAGFLFAASVASGFLCAGCARFPEAREIVPVTQLLVTLRVRGQIQSSDAQTPYYYFVLINRTDTQSDAGPVPVVERPWGNGFAAPAQAGAQGFVGFVRYDRFQGQGGYGVYRVEDRPTGNDYTPLVFSFQGPPDQARTPQTGEKELSFRLDLARLKRNPSDPEPRFVQINLLATNNLPQGAEDVRKYWDALGNGALQGTINTWITLPTDRNIVRTNDDVSPDAREPAADVRENLDRVVEEPNLDIVDWRFEIRFTPTRAD